MNWDLFFLLLMSFAVLDVGWVNGTCVFSSDFGFTLNCGFKKSSLFRIKNLGGVKGYVGLGFSVGDELAFAEALGNEEDQNKRSANDVNAPSDPQSRGDGEITGRSHSGRNPLLAWATVGGMPAGTLPGSLAGTLPGTLPGSVLPGAMPGLPLGLPAPPPTIPPFKPLGGSNPKNNSATVPPFSALPPSIARIPVINNVRQPAPVVPPALPVQQPAPLLFQNAMQMANRRFQVVPNKDEMPLKTNIIVGKVVEPVQEPQQGPAPNTLSLRTLNAQTVKPSTQPSPSAQIAGIDVTSPSPLLMGHSVQSLAQASNISVEALAAALRLREQQLLASVTATTTTSTTTTTTTTTTTPPPPTRPPTIRPRYPLVGPNRVMNAPKEYYPVSYDKNYDDNFTSKVELPDTSFSCGDQKHFPGLYADEDLGCMVFHVCAFTDDGMVMKSFLCPESTLFDQSILKCNWWFYVDCKASRKLYDSNIPISKSYQLMKALAFFSAYKNQTSNVT